MHSSDAVRAHVPRRRRPRPPVPIGVLVSTIFALVAALLGAGAQQAQAAGETSHQCRYTGDGKNAEDCVFMLAKDQRAMDVPWSSSDSGTWLQAYDRHDGSNQVFSLQPQGDGSFQIKTNSGLCLMPGWWDSTWRMRPVEQQRCDGSQKYQYWYFEPGQSKGSGTTFMIRNVVDDQCMDVASSWLAGHSDYLNMWPCHGKENQLWGSRFGGGKDFTTDWAAKYALTKCDAAVLAHSAYPYCSYSQTQAAVTGNDAGVALCLQAQHTDAAIPSTTVDYKVTNSTSTITTDSIANGTKETITVKLGSSSDFWHADFAVEASQLITHSVQTGTTNTEEKTYHAVVPAAPAHSTTWVKAFPVSKTYTGRFVFAKGSWDEWTYSTDAEITVTYPAGSGATMMYDSGVAADKLDENGQWVRQPACISDGPTRSMTTPDQPAPAPVQPQKPATASSFHSGFEPSDPAPAWTHAADTAGGGLHNVDGPQAGIGSDGTAHTGTGALVYSGSTRTGTDHADAYMKVYDLSGSPLAIGTAVPDRKALSYWIYPQSHVTAASVAEGARNSACAAVDLVFTDGSTLRDSWSWDQRGHRISPAEQCTALTLDTWNHVTVSLDENAGKQISRILVGYDQKTPGSGSYRGYIDDIAIS
ncbi:ricin-type beta-trefoil lectin domain protein [Streptomyces sp. NBC_00868]|uniref:RICIN domain-containing protein n=1 Tax=Streptomyces sp. NBC_00868 TaxID=2903683 RepID=UPI0038680373|nr:ricin-type beta-trefoil lectin domain protein [Streptomyces sp. NBC_00868]